MEQNQTQVPATQESVTKYSANGQEITLTHASVKKMLVKGNADSVNDQELSQFIALCKFNQLNPFLNEAYLIKYGGKSDSATMIVSKEAFMKRAESYPEYDGFKAGLIIKHEDGKYEEVEGSFSYGCPIIGGWAEVYRKDRDHKTTAKVDFKEYNTGKSNWVSKPGTMIRKVAIVQALREAFPVNLGAMYVEEDANTVVDTTAEDVTNKVEQEAKAPKQTIEAPKPAAEQPMKEAAPAAPAQTAAQQNNNEIPF